MKTKLEDLKVGTKVIITLNNLESEQPKIFRAIVTKEFKDAVLLEDTDKCIFQINQEILDDKEIDIIVIDSIN